MGAICGVLLALAGLPAGLPLSEPEAVGFQTGRLQEIESLIEAGLAEGKLPGCVVCFGRQGRIVWLKAYGQRQVQTTPEPMTTDTVFDLASLTQTIATATSTVLWIDPELDLFFIFLSNRVHPHDKGLINLLAGQTTTIVAGAIE